MNNSDISQTIYNGAVWALGVIDRHLGVVTLIAASFAYYIYINQQADHERDAALLILQELRYAEQKVRNYRVYGSFNYTEKVLPTNSWNKNISLFVNKLSETELDLISKFYSNAAYLDEVLKTVSDAQIRIAIEPTPTTIGGPPIATGTTAVTPKTQELIQAVSKEVDYIYNTPTAAKLQKMSKRRWYQLP